MLAQRAGALLNTLRYSLATAESLTGGLVGAEITSVPGASDYYWGGVISYATQIKNSLLGVSVEVLSTHGAVSQDTAAAMADGVKDLFRSTIGLSTTGVAGPDTQEGQPVGTLFVSVSEPSGTFTKKLSGPTVDREAVRSWAVTEALKFLVVRLESASERL